MNSRQLEVLDRHNNELHRRLEPSVKPLIAEVLAKQVISQKERDEIDAITLSTDKLTNLLFKLTAKENGFSALLSFIRDHDGKTFADTLAKDAGESSQSANGRERILWEVPLPNHFFTGRERLIDQLLKFFEHHGQAESKTILSACHGLGGVGKTQLAIEFIDRYQENFYDVFWFPAEDSSKIEIAYKQLAKEFKIDTQQPIDDIVREIKAWFAVHPGCLLIYDNASSSDVILKYMPERGCCVLATSRNTINWYAIGNEVSVDVYDMNEATVYITRILEDEVENQEQVQELAKRLGCLPLALAQACAYMRVSEVTISRYLALFEEKTERLLSGALPKKEHEPTFLTWNITMNAIQIESSFAANLLKMCSYLHSDDIPYFFLRQGINSRKQIFEDALGLLRTYSMIKVNKKKETISLHRILQEVMRLQLEKQSKPKFFRNAIVVVLEHYPHGHTLEDYQKQSSFIPHLESLLHHMDQQSNHVLFNSSCKKKILNFLGIEKCAASRNMLAVKILGALENAYRTFGDYNKQREYLERALVKKEKHYGSDHPEVAGTLNNLGNAYGSLGDYNKQREYLERALAINETHYGSDHREVAGTLNNLGNAYGRLGDYRKQREYLERALVIEEKHYGSDHPEVAKTLVNLGSAYESLGVYNKNRQYLESALAIEEKHYGPDHPEVAKTLVNLGNAYGSLGDYSKQREYLERALVILEKHYGPDHPEVAVTLNNLGNTYGRLRDYSKQREYLERALVIKEKHYGSNHPEVAGTLNNLGNAYGSLGDYSKQQEYLERALAINEKHYGSDHPEVAGTLNNLGNAHGRLGDYSKQREYLECGLVIDEKHYGPDHPEVAATLNNLGNAYGSLGDYNKQREFLERALAINEKHYGSEHPEVAAILNNLGNVYESLGDYNKQREYLECGLAIEEKHYGSNHPEVAATLNNLGNAHGSLGDYTKQREYLERALVIKEKNYGSDHPEVAGTLNNLGNAYGSLGDYNKQREYLERSLVIFEKHYGSDHPEVAVILNNLGNAHENLGDYNKQREYLERALVIKEKHNGSDHPEVAATFNNFELGNI